MEEKNLSNVNNQISSDGLISSQKSSQLHKDYDHKKRGKAKGGNPNKKKIITIISLILAGLIVVAGIVLLVIFLKPGKKLDVPQNLKVIENDNGTYVVCDVVEGASGYAFKIDDQVFNSNYSLFDITGFSNSREYNIRVSAIATGKERNSDFSQEIVYNKLERIDSPVIYCDTENVNLLKWASVENAIKYTLVYNGERLDVGNVNQYDLTNLGGGQYNIYLIAVPDLTRKPSLKSNQIIYEYYEKLSGVGGQLLADNKVQINHVDNATKYRVTINDKTYEVEKFTEPNYVFDAGVFDELKNKEITYLRIEAVGEGYFISAFKEIELN